MSSLKESFLKLFSKRSLYEIGLSGTKEEFDVALNKPIKEKVFSYHYNEVNKFLPLIKGADKGFDEGRPENLRRIIDVIVKQEEVNGYHSGIITLCGKNAEQIKKRLETLTESARILVLNACLQYVLDVESRIGEPKDKINNRLASAKALVEAGADIHDDNEKALRAAVNRGYLDVVKYLYEKGADFKEAIYAAEFEGRGATEKLKICQKHLTGIDPDANPKTTELLTQLRQQVKDLTERVARLTPQPAAKPGNPAP